MRSSLHRKTLLARRRGSPPKTLDIETESDVDETVDLVQPIIYSLDEKRNETFNIAISLRTCVHGYLAADKKQPASLIVFSVHLNCFRRARHFSRFDMDAEFSETSELNPMSEKENPSLQSEGPAIIQYAPHSRNSKESETEIEAKKTCSGSMKAETDLEFFSKGVKAEVAGSLTKEITERSKHRYFEICRAKARPRPNKDTPVAVKWVSVRSSNPHHTDDASLTPETLFAVLLQRRTGAKFEVKINFWADGGKRYTFQRCLEHFDASNNVQENMRKVLGCAWDQGGEMVRKEFDPSGLKCRGLVEGIKRNELGKFAVQNALEKLTEFGS
jgi:hypothetical protein